MTWAQEMKNLAAEIKTSHKDRRNEINGIKRETRNILGAADDYMKQVAAELKEMAKDLNEFLVKSEEKRIADFRALMQNIRATLKDISRTVEGIKRSSNAMLSDYKAERKEAAEHWASLEKRRKAVEAKEEAEEAERAEEKKK